MSCLEPMLSTGVTALQKAEPSGLSDLGPDLAVVAEAWPKMDPPTNTVLALRVGWVEGGATLCCGLRGLYGSFYFVSALYTTLSTARFCHPHPSVGEQTK